MKIPNKREFQQTSTNFIKTYKKCTEKPYYFLVDDTTVPSVDPLKFIKKNFLK